MTYYYIASDQPIKLVEGHLDAVYIDEMETFIKGFDLPIQLEMLSPENEKELFPLYIFMKF